MAIELQNETTHADAIERIERALLGSILEKNSLWPQAEALSVEDFSLDSHQRIYGRMAAMFEDGRIVDIPTLGVELADRNEMDACACLGSLPEHALPANFPSFVRQ